MKKKLTYAHFLLIILLGIGLRIAYLKQHDLWFDEAFSYFVSIQPINKLIVAVLADNHPPLYFLLLHYWIIIFGKSEIVIRSLSLVFGTLAVLVTYLTGKLISTKIGILAALLVTVSPLMLYFSAETRMYSLVVFLTLLSSYLWLRLLRKFSKLTTIFFILVFSSACYTHYFSLLLFLPFIFLCITLENTKRVHLLLTLFTSLLIDMPLIYFYLNQAHPAFLYQNSLIALPATLATFVVGGTGIVTLRSLFLRETSVIIKVFLALCLLSFIPTLYKGILKSSKNIYREQILYIFICPVVFLFFTNFFTPIFSIRPTIFLAPYFFILISIGLASFNSRWGKGYISILIISMLSIDLLYLKSPSFKGPEIYAATKKVTTSLPILHTSVLTYYPFQYYLDNSNNILLTTNPLNTETIDIISGKKEIIPLYKEINLVEIENGADKEELKEINKKILERYSQKAVIDIGEISIYKLILK